MKKKEYLKPVSEMLEVLVENELLQATNIIISTDSGNDGEDDGFEPL